MGFPLLLRSILFVAFLAASQACRRPESTVLGVGGSDAVFSRLSSSTIDTMFIQGGDAKNSLSKKSMSPSVKTTSRKSGVLALGVIAVSYLLWESRASWIGIFDKEAVLEKTLGVLHHLDEQPKVVSHTTYILGMTIWEALGLTTIPVETASGMVFGWAGFFLSSIGKLLGAILAFSLARYSPLASYIQGKLTTNEALQLIEDSAAIHPLQVTILMKLSCFPETIKNYGSALLFPIRFWMFVVATIGHGWTFSALWTYLGVDTANRLEVVGLPTDKRLQFFLTLALINGFLVSPLAMAYWIKNLREARQAEQKKGRPIWRPRTRKQ